MARLEPPACGPVSCSAPRMLELDPITLARAQRGDREARAAFVRAYQGPVYALLGRMLGPGRAPVDDAAQDCFLRALEALPRFDPTGPARLSTWVLTIATRLAIDALRHRRRFQGLAEGELSPVLDGEALELARREWAQVEVALAELSPEQRAILILRAHHDLDYPEIAAALSLEVGTVKSRLSRARAALREALSQPRRNFERPRS